MNSAQMFQEFRSNHELAVTFSSHEVLPAEPLSMEQEKHVLKDSAYATLASLMSPVTYISVNCEQHACRKYKKSSLEEQRKKTRKLYTGIFRKLACGA